MNLLCREATMKSAFDCIVEDFTNTPRLNLKSTAVFRNGIRPPTNREQTPESICTNSLVLFTHHRQTSLGPLKLSGISISFASFVACHFYG